MSATRPGEVNNGITTTRVPYSTAGLSVASKCLSAVVGNNSGLSNGRDGHAGERNKCEPTVEAIDPENTSPTRIRVDSSNYSSMSTTTSIRADATATMILSCLDGFEIRGDMCVPIVEEEPKQAIIARNPAGGDFYVGPKINNARARVRDAVKGQLLPRQSASESITTTITPILQTSGATDSSPAPSSPSASSSFVSPVNQIITTASPTPTSSPPLSTLTSIPLLVATGSYSTIYSIPSSIAPAPSPTASSDPKSSGLSVGAKAGITVGVVFLVLAIGVLLAMLHIKRRRKLQNNQLSSSRAQKKGKQQAPRTDLGTIEKGRPAPEHPLTSMQAALPPGFMVPYTAKSSPISPIGTHPGTKVEIDNSDRHAPIDTGPHELDVGEKFEMDAGYTGRESTIDSFPLGMSSSPSRGATPSIASRAVTPSLRDRSGSVASNARGVAPSLRERVSTIGELENISRGVTPMSSFSRGVTPDRGITPDARMGGGMGHISPLSHTTERTERSFLDLD